MQHCSYRSYEHYATMQLSYGSLYYYRGDIQNFKENSPWTKYCACARNPAVHYFLVGGVWMWILLQSYRPQCRQGLRWSLTHCICYYYFNNYNNNKYNNNYNNHTYKKNNNYYKYRTLPTVSLWANFWHLFLKKHQISPPEYKSILFPINTIETIKFCDDFNISLRVGNLKNI